MRSMAPARGDLGMDRFDLRFGERLRPVHDLLFIEPGDLITSETEHCGEDVRRILAAAGAPRQTRPGVSDILGTTP
jgi:hypothetical protein